MIKRVLLGLFLALAPAPAPAHSAQISTGSGPELVLTDGRIRGQTVGVKGSEKLVDQFLGIPFASPPVGSRRLTEPKPVEPWEGVKNVTRQPPLCLQNQEAFISVTKSLSLNYTAPGNSEDCLYLNVYTPSQRSESEKLPVMVWIPGGGLVFGGASVYDGSSLAAYENIVVVVIQYRLGLLGFLSTGDKHSPGNWGFLDQIAALQWVQKNIDVFGGNPKSVTVAGESAGGISASLLTLSPLTEGLFHRAIFQSGVASVSGYFTKDHFKFAKTVANATDCDYSSSEVLVSCIKSLTEEQIIQSTKKHSLFFGATLDGHFLKDREENLLRNKDFRKVPVLIGTTNHEFGWVIPKAYMPPKWETGMDRKSLVSIVVELHKVAAAGANKLIADEYTKKAKTPEDFRDRFTEMMGDIFMVLPTIKVANYHRNAGVPVYMYEFQHRPSIFKDLRPSFVKADHADDVGFVLGGCFWDGDITFNGTLTEDENQLCRTLMKYWANFVRTGDPNGPDLVHWPVYDQTQKHLNLGLQQTEGQALRADRIQFFTVDLPAKVAALQKK